MYIIMEDNPAYDFALAETIRRLKECRTYSTHDPSCDCDNPKTCIRKAKCLEPTEWCLQPLQDYKTAYTENFKKVLKNKMISKNEKATKYEDWCFLTINPYPHIKLENFTKKLTQFLKTKMFADHIAVLEQREVKTEALGKGFHAHILFKRITPLNEGRPPTQIRRNMKQSWKNYCDTTNSDILNIQFIGDDFAYDKYEYIMGTKTAPGKKEKQDGDKLWRKQNNLPEYLGNKNIM